MPSRLIGRQVRVVLRSSELVVYWRHEEAARHPRLTAKGAERLDLDHYLEALVRKPGAMSGSAPLDQARASGAFTAAREAFWPAARRALGEPAESRELIGILLPPGTWPLPTVDAYDQLLRRRTAKEGPSRPCGCREYCHLMRPANIHV